MSKERQGKLVLMPRPAPARQTPARRPPARRKVIVWPIFIAIFLAMMGALFAAQLYLPRYFPGNPLFANGSLGLSIIFGIVGAFCISRFGMRVPPPPPPAPSKSQQRRMAAAARTQEAPAPETDKPIPEVASVGPRSRRRRRR